MHVSQNKPLSTLAAGIACLKEGNRLDEAASLLEAAWRAQPTGRDERLWLAVAYRGQRRLPQAAQMLDGLLIDRPDDSDALAHRGVVAFLENDIEGAAQRLCAAWCADPGNGYARDWLERLDGATMGRALTTLFWTARAFPDRPEIATLAASKLAAGLQFHLAQGQQVEAESLAQALESLGSPLASWLTAGRYRHPLAAALGELVGTVGPVRIMDVGASGYTVRDGWELFGPALEVHGVDPDTEACLVLNSLASREGRNQHFYPVALAGTQGTRTLNVTRSPYCSSLLEPNMPLLRRLKQFDMAGNSGSVAPAFDVLSTILIQTTTLDACIADHAVGPLDHIKLDVQGAELEVLQGGIKTLQHATSVLVEVEFVPLYKDQPLFADIDMFLRAQGFTFFGFQHTHSGHYAGRTASPLQVTTRDDVAPIRQIAGQLVTSDALYLRDPLADDQGNPQTGMPWQRWLRAAAIAAVLDQPEFALELVAWLLPAVPDGDLARRLRSLLNQAPD